MKEMKNVGPAFEIFEGRVDDLVYYQKIECHVVWDIKLGENFRKKERLVARGHTTDTPSSITYSSVISRDSVRIVHTLNDLKILACDIQNHIQQPIIAKRNILSLDPNLVLKLVVF